MLYPKISNVKRNNKIITGLMIGSIVLAIALVSINYYTEQKMHWSWLAIIGIIYCWITTIYSIKRNVNIASHVMLQMLCISIGLVLIDYIIGYKGWSMKIGMPIIIIVANVTMCILTIVSRKRYANYSFYQIMILFVTIVMLLLIPLGVTKLNTLYIIASMISIISMIISFLLCRKELINEFRKTFHM